MYQQQQQVGDPGIPAESSTWALCEEGKMKTLWDVHLLYECEELGTSSQNHTVAWVKGP